jgi:hypothetical protein
MKNPYPKQAGFNFRVLNARRALEKLGQDPSARIFTRRFDSYFEMFDGDAVVWQLIHMVRTEKAELLEKGIKTMCGNAECLQRWNNYYENPQKLQSGLFAQVVQ